MSATTAAAAIAATRQIIKVSTQVIKYIRDDQSAKLGLLQPVRMVLEGPGLGIGDFQSPDHLFKMLSPTINRVEFSFLSFPADAKSPWNGPDGIPNKWKGGAVPGSLPHDFICLYCHQIAAELGITADEVWVWASGVLAIVWDYYGGSNLRSESESWLAYNVTRIFQRPYIWIKRRLKFSAMLFIVALVSSGCDSGCLSSPPPGKVVEATPIVWVEDGVVTTNTPPSALAE